MCSSYSPRSDLCDSICWNLGADFELSLIAEYRSIDQWARDFALAANRKPHASDVRARFGVRNIPTHASAELFAPRSSRSFFEDRVEAELLKIDSSLTVLRNTRPLRENGRLLEIDILLPDLKLGIEVQDEATHDPYSDSIVGRFGLKHGPSYFATKQRLASAQGVRLEELWESEVLSVNLTERLVQLMTRA